jgi:hypothetical protein
MICTHLSGCFQGMWMLSRSWCSKRSRAHEHASNMHGALANVLSDSVPAGSTRFTPGSSQLAQLVCSAQADVQLFLRAPSKFHHRLCILLEEANGSVSLVLGACLSKMVSNELIVHTSLSLICSSQDCLHVLSKVTA